MRLRGRGRRRRRDPPTMALPALGGRQEPITVRRGELRRRLLAALPAIAVALFIVAEGGLIFTLALIALGLLALHELYTMMRRVRPVNLAGFLAIAAMCLAANYGDRAQVLLLFVLSLPVSFGVAILRPRRQHASWAIAATLLGVTWIGMALAHAILLRRLPHGGGLLIDVLIGTFVGDTAAYFGGRAWGRRALAPRISPSKTIEGLIAGIVGGTFAFWVFAALYQDWFKGTDALLTGLAVASAAPVGDLFESLVKRDLGVKDTGRLFGAHGGVLDRLDAVFFTVVSAYYVTLALR